MILFNVISNLSSSASKICIERDWVIVIAKSCGTNIDLSLPEDVKEKKAKTKLTSNQFIFLFFV